MNKQLKKNKLDLEYHKNTQILNAVFIFLTTGILGFMGSFIFLGERNKLLLGMGISSIIIILGFFIYKKINKKLEYILKEIEKI